MRMKKRASNSSGHCSIVETMNPAALNSSLAGIARYGVIGFLNNSVGYLIYLLLTWRWLDPKAAVTLLYPIGAFIGYYGNATFAFSYTGSHLTGLIRYVAAHVVGYLLNILIIFVFVDLLGYSHLVIQAIAILLVAGILFVLFRCCVFPQRA